jgi:hypothetical protein
LKKNERRWRGILVVRWIGRTRTRSGLELDVSQSILRAEYRLVDRSMKTMESSVARWDPSMKMKACGAVRKRSSMRTRASGAGSKTAILGRHNQLLTSG